MKRVAVILPELLPVPPASGGAVEYWVHEATRRFASNECEISVVSRPSDSGHLPKVRYVGVPWTPFSRWLYRLKEKSKRRGLIRAVAKIQNVISYGLRAMRNLDSYDTICIENEPNLLLFLKKRNGQKVVLHMHNAHLESFPLRMLYRHMLKKVDEVVCVSDFIRKGALVHYPEIAQKFSVMINAADVEFFTPHHDAGLCVLSELPPKSPGEVYIGYVGRLTADKGAHVLLSVFRRLCEGHDNIKLLIAGSSFFASAAPSSYEAALMEMAKGLNDKIVFTGFLDHSKIPFLYNLLDIVVVPSIWQDPCPLVVLEAMASAKAVVASRVGGIPELIDGPAVGVLVRAGDEGDLYERIEWLMYDKSSRDAMGANARERTIRDFNWKDLADRYWELLGSTKC